MAPSSVIAYAIAACAFNRRSSVTASSFCSLAIGRSRMIALSALGGHLPGGPLALVRLLSVAGAV